MTIRAPETDTEWHAAVTLAEALLDIDIAFRFGLLVDTIEVDVDHCLAILRAGRARGVVPRTADVNAMTVDLITKILEDTHAQTTPMLVRPRDVGPPRG
jgi:hypothetical protein